MTFNFLVVYQVSLSEKKKVVWGLGGCFLDCLGCVEELRECGAKLNVKLLFWRVVRKQHR